MWAIVVFWILVIPLIILLSVVYATGKKLYRLLYILSVFTYAMTVVYAIDAFNMGKNGIIALLAFSSLLMIYMGYKLKEKKRRRK